MAAALETCIGIVRFRKGPEDLPASASLLVAAAAAATILGAASLVVFPQDSRPPLVPVLAIDLAATLLFLALLLRAAGHPERFTQTATAIFGVQVVLGPILLGSGWFVLAYARDPSWQAPAAMLGFVVGIWVLAIAGRILKSATGWPVIACIALVIAAELATSLLISGLFPSVPDAAASPPASSST